MSETAPIADTRRAGIAYLLIVVVLLMVLVPLVILDWDIPFLGAVVMIAAGAAVVYSVERWEDPARARKRWIGSLPMAAVLLVVLSAVVGFYVILMA